MPHSVERSPEQPDPSVTTEERIIAHLNFARAVAARSLDPRCRGADREDLIAWGVLGLVQANSKLLPLRNPPAEDGSAPESATDQVPEARVRRFSPDRASNHPVDRTRDTGQ